MKKYLTSYIKEMEDKLKENKEFGKTDITNFKDKIIFFQHERLIHLLVTLAYALFTLIFLVLGLISYIFLIPMAMGLIFLLFYIPYYFFLEHAVQYLYKLYDKALNNGK